MSEIEKLYRNAGIEPDCTYLFLVNGNGENEAARTMSIGSKADLKRLIVDCGVKGKVIKSTNTLKPFYPPFTAEKQLNIIKWLLKSYDIGLSQLGERIDTSLDGVNCISGLGSGNTFEESLAQAINDLWQDLTEEERKQVKEILEEPFESEEV